MGYKMKKTTAQSIADVKRSLTALGKALGKAAFDKADIRSEKREDGKLWYTPYRRIVPFIWTHYFKGQIFGEVCYRSISSTHLDVIKDFLVKQGYKCS
jgi:hypothetical protein